MRLTNILIVSLFLFSFLLLNSRHSYAQCKPIEVEVSVVNAQRGSNSGSISIDLKGLDAKKLSISLLGPKAKNQLNTQKSEFKGLIKGSYSIIIAGKSEDDNYCQFFKEVIIN